MKLIKSILLVALLATSSFADDNPRLMMYPPNKIMGFLGLDTQSSSTNIQDGRASDLLNVKLSSAFNLRKRYGYDTVNDACLDDFSFTSPSITGIFDSEYSTGSYTLAFVGNKLKYDNSGEWSDVVGTGTITSGQDYRWQCVMALDYAVCTNDQDPPLKVNSVPQHAALNFTGLSDAVTDARAVIWFRNYLIFGNTYENSLRKATRFRWSDVGTIETWQDDNYVDISSLSGDEIVAFKEMYGDLYIIMRKSIWRVSLVGGDDVFSFTKIIDGIGAIAWDSVHILNFPENKLGIIFLSEDKRIYLFNGITVTDIGHVIQPTLNNLSASRLEYASGIFDGEYYYLSVTDSGGSINDKTLVYNTLINEWSVYSQVDANAFARVKESTALVKTYFGNYSSCVYWLDNPDLKNDVAGATGIIDSTATVTSVSETGAQALIDLTLPSGVYTGAICRITSGTGAGEERVIIDHTGTYLVAATAFSTTPDSTSNYSIGDINSYYQTKWYDFGDAPRYKGFLGVYFWGQEESGNEVIVSYSQDFSNTLGSETISLSPESSSLWDEAIWDESTWGTTGDKFYTSKLKGYGRFLQLKFEQAGVDKTFNIYGFHMLGERLDVE